MAERGDIVTATQLHAGPSWSFANTATRVRALLTNSLAGAVGLAWDGVELVAAASTLTITGGAVAITALNAVTLAQPTITKADAGDVTVTDASTLYIANAPARSGNVTAITNAWALNVAAGSSRFASSVYVNTLTATQVVYAGTNGLLSGEAGLTWDAGGDVLRVGPTGASGTAIGPSSLDVGLGAVGNQFAYIDLIGDATYVDYGARFIRNNTGANTTTQLLHRGTGVFYIRAEDDGGTLELGAAGNDVLHIDGSRNVAAAETYYNAGLIRAQTIALSSSTLTSAIAFNVNTLTINTTGAAQTVTTACSLYIDGDPVLGANATATERLSFYVAGGIIRLGVDVGQNYGVLVGTDGGASTEYNIFRNTAHTNSLISKGSISIAQNANFYGFNVYYQGGFKAINAGYGSWIRSDGSDQLLQFYTSSDSVATQNTFTSAIAMYITKDLDVVAGNIAGTTDTTGFLFVTAGAGAPTGVLTNPTRHSAIYVDTTNVRVYFRVGAAWRYAALT